MAITFPAAPTNGQVYTDTTSGQSWTFDGVKWKGASSTAYWKRTGTAVEPYTAGDTIKGQLVPTNGALGFRNVLINGDLRINQRGVTIAAAAVGAYGPDRWKKVDATNMTQVVEDLNFVPGAKYTLSWKGGTPQVLTAPASGHWTLPNIPITATEVQLELGIQVTPYEYRNFGLEMLLCYRYYCKTNFYGGGNAGGAGGARACSVHFPVRMRATPSIAFSALNAGNCHTPYADKTSETHTGIAVTTNGAGSFHIDGVIDASAEL
jgi:hypothetical protein